MKMRSLLTIKGLLILAVFFAISGAAVYAATLAMVRRDIGATVQIEVPAELPQDALQIFADPGLGEELRHLDFQSVLAVQFPFYGNDPLPGSRSYIPAFLRNNSDQRMFVQLGTAQEIGDFGEICLASQRGGPCYDRGPAIPPGGVLQAWVRFQALNGTAPGAHGFTARFVGTIRQPEGPDGLPILNVTRWGVPADQATLLEGALGIDGILQTDGSLRFTDQDKFEQVPTLFVDNIGSSGEDGVTDAAVERFDYDTLGNLVPISHEAAEEKVRVALEAAGLWPQGVDGVNMSIDNARFMAVDGSGTTIVEAAIDTNASFEFFAFGIPLSGPGAKIRFAFHPDGGVTQLTYVLPQYEEGPWLPVISPHDAIERAVEVAGFNPEDLQSGRVQLDAHLAYWAPAPKDIFGDDKTFILPYWIVGGIMQDPDSDIPVQLRRMLVPAVDHDEFVPRVNLEATVEASGTIAAAAEGFGGTAPYTYLFTSTSTDLGTQSEIGPTGDPATINYAAASRGDETTITETLVVHMVDSNGVIARASRTLKNVITQLSEQPLEPLVGGTIDVGAEYVGAVQNLSGSSANAGGFRSEFQSNGTTIRFYWGDNDAWEQDFKDPSNGGDDDNFVDNADLVFFTGHANGNGWNFPGNNQDTKLHFNDAELGDKDLEWIVIAACGPLQMSNGNGEWWQRWGSAFQGLHLLNGYQTITFDNTDEGEEFAERLLNGWRVRTAWKQTAIDVQPATYESGKKIYVSTMGPLHNDGWTNYNDRFHGEGSVGPDIRGSDLDGWWIVWSST